MFTSSDQQPSSCFHSNHKPIFSMERKWIKSDNVSVAPNCPRCASSNTKFCYYNNYSLLQPRYFCKGCRRYWTKGGSLRNVPVGGGCRKSRKSIKNGGNKHRANSPWRSGNDSSYGSHLDGLVAEAKFNCDDPTTTTRTSNSLSSSPNGRVIDSVLPGEQLQLVESNGGGIDLAAVFAKFLSQGSCSDDKFLGHDLVDVSKSRCPDGRINELMDDFRNPAGSLPVFDQPLEEDWSGTVLEEYQPHNFQVQGVLERTCQLEVAENIHNGNWMEQLDSKLWSEADDQHLESFASQLPQLQHFDSFSAGGDHLELSAEFTRDISCWNYFDVIGVESFTNLFT